MTVTGPPVVWKQLIAPSKPFVTVTSNGPDDGGDYGPNTQVGGVPTTTCGIQEALNALGNGISMVRVAPGSYTIASNLTLPAKSHLHFEAGVTLTWTNSAIMKITSGGGVTVTSDVMGAFDGSAYAPNISALTIDSTSNAIYDIVVEGFIIGATANTTQACVTFNNPGSNEIDQVHFTRCGFAGSVVVTNPTSGGQGSPTEIYFDTCIFAGANQTSASIHADMLGQWFFADCTFVSYQNSHVLFQLDGNNAVAQVSNGIQLANCQWVANAGLTGLTLLSILNNATMAVFVVEGMYIEDNSPVLLLNVGASGADAEGKLMIAFRDISGFTSGGITLADISASADVTNQSMILFDHIGSAYAPAAIGTIPGFDYPNVRIKNCFGLNEIGTTPLLCPPTLQKSETGADSSLLSFTPISTAGTYKLKVSMDVSAENTYTLFGWTATWTDSNGHAQAPTYLSLYQSGVAAPALNFTPAANGHYYGEADVDINNSGTSIVIKTTGSGTSIAYKASAWIERVQ